MSLAVNDTRKATIDWIEEGKVWSGKDGTEMKEYKVSLKNGDIPVFNYPASKVYPFAKGDIVSYLLTERVDKITKKIIQNGKQMKKVEEQTTNTSTDNSTMTQQQSIALSVATKSALEVVLSDTWQKTLKLKDEDKTKVQSELLSSIGQVTIAFYNLLTSKPQSNG